MPKAGYITRGDMEYVREFACTMSDKDLANHLGRDVRTIARTRKKLGITKGASGHMKALVTKELSNNIEPTIPAFQMLASQKMNENQRKEFFKTQLVNSLYYDTLQEQFTKEEINFYLEEWGALSVQFDDIANTEKRQIDDLIKAEIMGNRMLRNIKIAEDQISLLIEEVEDLRKEKDMPNNAEAQERDTAILNLIRGIHGQTQVMGNDQQKNVDLRNRLLDQLNARRKDRIDQIKKGGTTFISLVEAFRDKQLRATQGRHIELVRLAKEKKRAEWNKPIQFPDGTKDCVLMDENSILPEQHVVIESEECKLVNKYSKLKDSDILIIDDDIRRQAFFGQLFKDNKLIYATNFSKSKEVIGEDKTYKLICLDYDLGMNDKGDAIVNYILNKNLYKDTEILIHSMNKEGAEKLKQMLINERTLEVYPFEDIVKFLQTKEIEDQNAEKSISDGNN